MKLKFALAACLFTALTTSAASAASISLNESGLDLLYGQIGIDIRYNSSQTIFNTSLLSIDTDEEFNALSLYEVGGNTISMFFVDAINFCGAFVPGIVGCGSTPGTLVALDSAFVANEDAAVTATGHEIGHNLGLDHEEGNGGRNLMNPGTFTFDPLDMPIITNLQRDAIYLSPLVQIDPLSGQKFISITPFLVSASVGVPEPSTLSLLGLALGAVVWKKRRANAA